MIGSAVAALTPPGTHPAVLWGIILGAEIPDIDFVVGYWGGRAGYLTAHRGPTHGVLSLLLEAGVIAGGLTVIAPQAPFWTVYWWSLLGCLSHVAFDVGNDYGTKVLWPFSRQRIALDLIPIIDFWVLGAFAVGWAGSAVWPVNRRAIFAVAWILIAAYWLLRFALRRKAYRLVAERFDLSEAHGDAAASGDGWIPERVTVHPTLLSLNAWRYVVQVSGAYLTGRVWAFDGTVSEPHRARNDMDKVVKASLQAQMVDAFAQWVRKPRVQVDRIDSLYRVKWTDMRYEMDDYSPFTAYAWLDDKLTLVDEGLASQSPPTRDKTRLRRRLRYEMGRRD